MKCSISTNFLKNAASVALALVMLGFGLHFLQQEGVQVAQVREALGRADMRWLLAGTVLSVGYVWLHAEMYRQCFRAVGAAVGLPSMVRLYLKRNFVSVFLPAGFLSSQMFFGGEVTRTEKVDEARVLAVSGLFPMAGLLSMIVAVLPALGWLLTKDILPGGAAAAFLAMAVFFFGLVAAIVNFAQRGAAYFFCKKNLPALTVKMDKLDLSGFERKYFINAVLLSCVVELIGVLHVFVSARTLGVADATLPMAFAGYMAVLVVLMTAPFLRGIGAVEALLTLVLMRFGVEAVAAASVSVLFRFFEFWLVLGLGALPFLFRKNSLLLRVAPSLLIFGLGMVDILSGLTPALADRAKILRGYLPLETIHASTSLTVAVGFVLLATAFYLFLGLRNAWWAAIVLSAVSAISHLTKGIDYEESLLALLTIGVLFYQRKDYCMRTGLNWSKRRWVVALVVVAAVLALGTYGFWQLDHVHFGADFSWKQSAKYALRSFFMMDIPEIRAQTFFGHEFLDMMQMLGGLALGFLAWLVFRPFLPSFQSEDADREKAIELVHEHGKSALDYFKTYADKKFFFPKNGQSFVSYKNTARYALALENPVAPDEGTLRESIREFDLFCLKNGLRSIYYRVPEASTALYRSMGKTLLPLGQEALVDLGVFSLEGKEHKSLRNALSKMDRDGFRFVAREGPQDGRLLQQLRAVSDEWLRMLGRTELSFSQGVFDEKELKNQSILALENPEGKILAFVNLIPGGSPGEVSFDLMRRTEDAPPGTMDFLFVKMFLYLKGKNFAACNLGLVPMSGLDQPSNLSENLLKFAYERVPQFASYRSLRFFKEKFNPTWETKYVAYDSQMDLLNLPAALGRVVHA